MKHCPKCHVKVPTKEEFCPLCQGVLVGEYEGEEVYPYVPTIYKKYQKFFRWLFFVCFSISTICVAINLMFPVDVFWSGFVVAAFICLLIVLWLLINKKGNIPKKIIVQTVLLSLIACLWDYFTGWKGWSTTYVIPIIGVIASVDMTILVKVLHLYIEDYLIYCIAIMAIGLLPIIFLLTGLVFMPYPSGVCILVNLISLGFIVVFNFEKVVEELKRRLHL